MKNKNPIIRFFKHMFSGVWQVHGHFSEAALSNIEQAIKTSEATHDGEIRFVVEAGLHPYEIVFKKTPKNRAIELFGRLNIWDTEHNNGVLIYLLLADRDVEIVADRGIHQHVGNAEWDRICHDMELKFRRGEFEAGVLQGIAEIGAHLHTHYPDDKTATKMPAKKPVQRKKKNEISNKSLIL
jgi:uncharacterized membrane protein